MGKSVGLIIIWQIIFDMHINITTDVAYISKPQRIVHISKPKIVYV